MVWRGGTAGPRLGRQEFFGTRRCVCEASRLLRDALRPRHDGPADRRTAIRPRPDGIGGRREEWWHEGLARIHAGSRARGAASRPCGDGHRLAHRGGKPRCETARRLAGDRLLRAAWLAASVQSAQGPGNWVSRPPDDRIPTFRCSAWSGAWVRLSKKRRRRRLRAGTAPLDFDDAAWDRQICPSSSSATTLFRRSDAARTCRAEPTSVRVRRSVCHPPQPSNTPTSSPAPSRATNGCSHRGCRATRSTSAPWTMQ